MANGLNFSNSLELQEKSHRLIPGGCHTYAKGDDQYPTLSPGFIAKGQGCHVWDIDGNKYIEYGMGNRCVTLGHAFPAVIKAVQEEVIRGVNFPRPSPIEVDCAEALLSIIEGGEMVKFTKNGSDATTAALKLARAFTGRDFVAYCSDHPFFSTDDWFIGMTPMDSGVPQAIKDLTLSFGYNDIGSVERLFKNHPGKIAGLIMEAAKYEDPKDNFLHEVQKLCNENGALFILDEMITGFRWHIGGAQKYYNIIPDLSLFGKGMGNGFAISALVGKRDIMELGGIQHSKERVFLLSTTHGGETHSLAAAIATIVAYKRESVIEYLEQIGQRLADGLNEVIQSHGLGEYIQILGKPCNMVFTTLDSERKPSQVFRSLFLQEIIKRGVIGPSLVVSFSHTENDVDHTIDVVNQVLGTYKVALENGAEKYLVGRPSKIVYRRYN